MIAVDYYWAKAQEALNKADTQAPLSSCFVSIALVYQALADGEVHFQKRFPKIPPRTLVRDASE